MEEHGESLTERVKDVIKKTTPKKVEKGKDVEQKRREIKQQRHEKENEQREEKLGVRPEGIYRPVCSSTTQRNHVALLVPNGEASVYGD